MTGGSIVSRLLLFAPYTSYFSC